MPSIAQKPPSRFTLGSVQFGLEYGVANRHGRPTYPTVREIIGEACQGGVDVIDTAPYYGESEEWIGRALDDLRMRDRVRVMTKVEVLPPDLSRQDAARRIEASVTLSLRRMGLERLPVCLFHREDNIQYADELLALTARGLIEAAGVSLVHPEFGWKTLKIPEFKVFQIATNVLDRRYTHSGLTEAAKTAGVAVFVRSVYLQGLLLMDDAATPPFLRGVIPSRQKVREVASRFGLPMSELLMRAILSRTDVSSIVVGVETTAQIRENLAHFAKGPLPGEVVSALAALRPDLPEFIVVPPDWDKAKASFEQKQNPIAPPS